MARRRLSRPEKLLWKAFPHGGWADLRTGDPAADAVSAAAAWGPERTIRAEVIAALLLGAVAPAPGRRPAIRLRGARVEGRLDLIGAEVPYTLVCEDCRFDGPVRLVEATTRTVRLTGCDIPHVNAPRLTMDGLLNLHRTRVRHGLRLDRARVSGEISLRGARIGPDPDGVAVAADGLVVDGPMEANEGFHATGAVRLRNSRIAALLSLEDAVVEAPGFAGAALSLNRAALGGGLTASGLTVHGEMSLRGARAEGVHLDRAALRNPGGIALGAGGLVVEGPFFARNGFTAEGEVRLPGAQIRTFLTIPGAALSAPGGMALWLDQLTVNDVDATGLTATGKVRLAGAQIANDLTLAGARVDGEGAGIAADNVTVGATFDCKGLRVRGEFTATVARVAGRLLLGGARLERPGRTCLRLSRAEIGADLFCSGLTAIGKVKVTGARVGRVLDLKDARLANPGGTALDGRHLQAGQLALRPAEPIQGAVALDHARLGLLRDDPDRWPAALSLNGLAYEALEPRLPARRRLRWLALEPDGYQPHPYEQLAASYAALGQPKEARRILLAKERAHRRGGTPFGKVWGVVQDGAVGYGYQPWRAVLWLALLVTAGSLVYAADPPAPLKPGEAPHFNPVVYTLDLLLPLVDLGQERAFNPAGGHQWFSYALVAAGWILVTVIAAAVARVLTRR
ncbi:hypothetical protein [Spirillospora sp. NPDC029432]|uniref:hypothetical protein n=1 Tax=Spirillospora sp. NPDC029432 TaxID=3154599 RepID=UPI003453D443